MTHRVLLVIGGGIAAYKCLDLIRRMREQGCVVRTVMTRAAQAFVTPLSVSALSNERVFTDLFNLDDEREIGHIRLGREADLIVVAPATADLLAKMAHGLADDLATAVLLAAKAPILAVPAMNPRMWRHPATCRNVATLLGDGVHILEPATGEMAESGEAGWGRLPEVPVILARIMEVLVGPAKDGADRAFINPSSDDHLLARRPLANRHILVTSGPTHEPIDPVRYIANRSSGRQGHAIAEAAHQLGARVTLVTGPVTLADPEHVTVVHVETADEMLAAVRAALPVDIAVFAAAVADWRASEAASQKIKKKQGGGSPTLGLRENPDILRTIAAKGPERPRLVIGFAAETQDLLKNADAKLRAKGADWIVANDVSPESGVMGGDTNTVHLLTASGVESWPSLPKDEVARRLMARAAREVRGEDE